MSLDIGSVARFLRILGSYILGLGLLGLGVACFIDPVEAAVMYFGEKHRGSSGGDSVKWVEVTGLRDAGLGLATLVLARYSPASIKVLAPCLFLIPVGDAIITYRHDGDALNVVIHCLGSICILILSMCAALDPTLQLEAGKAKAA